MAYYIIYFDNFGKVVDISRYSESEYSEYDRRVSQLLSDTVLQDIKFQCGYF